MTRPLSMLIACLLASCSGDNSRVQLGDYVLEPAQADFWSGTVVVGTAVPLSTVIVSNVKDLCKQYPSVNVCRTSAGALPLPSADGVYLSVAVLGSAEGDYDPKSANLATRGFLNFNVVVDGELVFSDEAASGRITFRTLEPGSEASGDFDVVMKSGKTLSGKFDASYCAGLDQLSRKVTAAAYKCTDNPTTTTCSSTCSCSGQSNSVSCSRPDSSSDWVCQCTHLGTGSSCSVPRAEANACLASASCCDMSF